ncbi:efflux RND transporter periplasmic adaptor subunit [Desulforamulus ferrireducens]|uniref:efflux RND transporter periplasmic adaptor subunit n=1 Tax=Desulforamulus ferrireducens TaxID=1833852 RepID=UPI001EE3FEDD|nr:efflux RND transporter periplasmic adaptor subunit [Desulforamulus ferrireducens]
MLRKKKLLLGILVLAMLLLTGCNAGTETGADSKESKTDNIAEAETSPKSPGTVVISGKIEAVQMANLVSKVAGKVEMVHVDIGTPVKAGQVLMSLDAGDKAAEIEVATAQVNSAQVEYELAQSNYQRGQELLAAQAISQAEYEKTYEGPFKRAEAQLQSAQASLKKQQITYNDMFMKAPFDGVITARNINPGEMAGTQNTVFTLVNLDQVVIKGMVNENFINQLQNGQAVKVRVPAASDQEFTGVINNLGLSADLQAKGYPVKIKLENPDHILKPGMFAEVILEGKK